MQRFLYLSEKGSLSFNDILLNDNTADDDYLFSNISELQSKNIQLAEEVERLRSEQEKIIENHHNSKFDFFNSKNLLTLE